MCINTFEIVWIMHDNYINRQKASILRCMIIINVNIYKPRIYVYIYIGT